MEFNPKIAGIVAGVAFLLSLLLGIAGGASFGGAFLRALVFAALFFVLAAFILIAVSRFLKIEDHNTQPAGSANNDEGLLGTNVDILSDGANEEENTEIWRPDAGGEESVDNDISPQAGAGDFGGGELPGRGLEQNNVFQYNPDVGGGAPQSGPANFQDLSEFVPGLSGMGGSAVSRKENTPPGSMEDVEVSVGQHPMRKNIEFSDLGKDADGKKVAQSIQILLKKDEG